MATSGSRSEWGYSNFWSNYNNVNPPPTPAGSSSSGATTVKAHPKRNLDNHETAGKKRGKGREKTSGIPQWAKHIHNMPRVPQSFPQFQASATQARPHPSPDRDNARTGRAPFPGNSSPSNPIPNYPESAWQAPRDEGLRFPPMPGSAHPFGTTGNVDGGRSFGNGPDIDSQSGTGSARDGGGESGRGESNHPGQGPGDLGSGDGIHSSGAHDRDESSTRKDNTYGTNAGEPEGSGNSDDPQASFQDGQRPMSSNGNAGGVPSASFGDEDFMTGGDGLSGGGTSNNVGSAPDEGGQGGGAGGGPGGNDHDGVASEDEELRGRDDSENDGRGGGGGGDHGRSDNNYNSHDYIHRDEFGVHWDLLSGRVNNIANNLGELSNVVETGFQRIGSLLESRLPSSDKDFSTQHQKERNSKRKAKEPKITSFPKRRSSQSNVDAKLIRDYLARLVGSGSQIQTVSIEESTAFAATWFHDEGRSSQPCCTLTNFKIDLTGHPTSPWNKSAAQVFFRGFVTSHPLNEPEAHYEAIIDRFLTRIKALKADARIRLLSTRERDENARRWRRAARKKQLFVSRLDIATEDVYLQNHIDIIQRLGPEGMSSDESDAEFVISPSQRRLQRFATNILRPRWRSAEVTMWLRVFDTVYHVTRRSKGSSRGAWPHPRTENAGAPKYSSKSKCVWGLPLSAYDSNWLREQRDPQYSVRPSGTYDFTHHPNLLNQYLYSESDHHD